MENKIYTIKDIARMAGVSAGTVDRVLHNRGDVSLASMEKVQKVLDEIDYQPNVFAIGLIYTIRMPTSSHTKKRAGFSNKNRPMRY